MDISEMMVGGVSKTIEPDAEQVIPQNLDAADDDIDEAPDMAVAEMTAVERIRAYRDGTLAPPWIGRSEVSEDDAENDTGDSDDADPPGGDGGGHPHDDLDANPADTGHDQASATNAGWRRFPVPRKALLIGIPAAVGLLVAGIAIPSMSGGDKTDTAAVVPQSASGSLAPSGVAAPAVVPDGVIAPAKVDAAEYPISLTPPTDAFSGEKGKAWVCAGLDGTVLTITLPAPMVVTEIGVVPGFDGVDKDGADEWAKHRIVTSVAYNLDYGAPVYAEYSNKRERQTTTFDNAVTQTIRMVILGTEDISGKTPATGTASSSAAPSPGLLGDLSPLGLDPAKTAPPAHDSRPAMFAIGSIEIIGHSPAR